MIGARARRGPDVSGTVLPVRRRDFPRRRIGLHLGRLLHGEETALVRAAQGGDEAAYAALYERHVNDVYGYVRYRVGDDAVAEDLTQDVFVKAFAALPSLEWRGSLRPWLLRCAHNRLANHWRTSQRGPTREPLPEEDELGADADAFARDELGGLAERGLVLDTVEDALRALTDLQREVLALRFGLELSVAETAEVMGRSQSAVKNLQHAGLGALRRALGEEGLP